MQQVQEKRAFAKLGEDGLEGRFVSEALSRPKIRGGGDLLDVLIGMGVEIDIAGVASV